jgi:predicted nucleic acid-binding protein
LTFLVDANVVIYSAVESPYREACLELLRGVALGKAEGYISTAILEEVWHVELSGRAGALNGLARRTYTTFTPLLPVTDATFALALKLDAPFLGSNDRIHAATCREHSLGTIVTADTAFDHVARLRRIDPLDQRALRRLLGP